LPTVDFQTAEFTIDKGMRLIDWLPDEHNKMMDQMGHTVTQEEGN
jgi:hypothetical protein